MLRRVVAFCFLMAIVLLFKLSNEPASASRDFPTAPSPAAATLTATPQSSHGSEGSFVQKGFVFAFAGFEPTAIASGSTGPVDPVLSYYIYLPMASKPEPTPTPTSTPTSTPTYTPSPTNTPEGTQVTVSDDFSDPTSGWPISDWSGRSLSYFDGEYRILVRSTNYTAKAASNVVTRFSDFHASVDARMDSGDSSFLGIAFGISGPQWTPFYACFVGRGLAELEQFTSAGPGRVPSSTSFPTDIDWMDRGYRRLEVIRSGSKVDCYAGGNLVATVNNLPPSVGEVGFIVVHNNPYGSLPADTRFDNYSVTGYSVAGSYAVFTSSLTNTSTSTATATSTPTDLPSATATSTPQS